MYNFKCPYCSTGLEADDNYTGKCISCPICSETIVVPDQFMPAGTEFAGYTIQEVICSNMLWTTYRAIGVTKSFGKTVALRVPTTFIKGQPDNLYKSFSTVVRNSGNVGIAEFPELVESSIEGEMPFFVYDSLPGGTILNHVNVSSTYSDCYEALRFVRRLSVALMKLWEERKVVIQSLKPSNICCYDNGKLHIMDLGLSQFALENPQLLDFGLDIWDESYTAPELIETGEANQPISDIFSLSGILFYVLTGRAPERNDANGVSVKSGNTLSVYNNAVPESISNLYKAMSSPVATSRPRDHKELLREIDKILQEEATTESKTTSSSYHETSTMSLNMSSLKDELNTPSKPSFDFGTNNSNTTEETPDSNAPENQKKSSMPIIAVVILVIIAAVAVFMSL